MDASACPACSERDARNADLERRLAYLTGCHGISKRGIEEFVETVFCVPIVLATVTHLGQEVNAALGPAHQEAIQAVRQADVKAERRQLCWAHLKRDVQKNVDCGGASFLSRRGLRIVKELIATWHAFQSGKVTRQKLQAMIEPLQQRLNRVMREHCAIGVHLVDFRHARRR